MQRFLLSLVVLAAILTGLWIAQDEAAAPSLEARAAEPVVTRLQTTCAASMRSGEHGADAAPALRTRGSAPRAAPARMEEDPWLPGEPAAGTSPAAPPRLRVDRITTDETGALALQRDDLALDALRSDPGLVVYDLSALAPEDVYPLRPLQGQYATEDESVAWQPVLPLAPARTWCRQLEAAILERVGTQDPSAGGSLLAWVADPSKGVLLLARQPPWALRRLEQVLDAFALRTLESVSVRVEVECADAAALRFALDVPWRRSARALQGLAAAYVMDFDVELSHEIFLGDPIVERLTTGVGVEAVLLDSPAGPADVVRLAIARFPGAPSFETLHVAGVGTNGIPPLDIEVSANKGHATEVCLPCEPGDHVVTLAPGVVVRIAVGARRSPRESGAPAWRRLPSAEVGPIRTPSAATFDVRLEGSHSGLVGMTSLTSLGTGSVLRRAAGERGATDAAVEASDLAVLRGAVLVSARPVGLPGSPLALDVTLEIGHGPMEVRVVSLRAGAQNPTRLALPQAALQIVSRRIHLGPDGSGAIRFAADLGNGTESCTLHVRPQPPTHQDR